MDPTAGSALGDLLRHENVEHHEAHEGEADEDGRDKEQAQFVHNLYMVGGMCSLSLFILPREYIHPHAFLTFYSLPPNS